MLPVVFVRKARSERQVNNFVALINTRPDKHGVQEVEHEAQFPAGSRTIYCLWVDSLDIEHRHLSLRSIAL